jgi:hypothetical protein
MALTIPPSEFEGVVWNVRTFSGVPANQPVVVSGPGIFGGVVVRAGMFAATVVVYDARDVTNKVFPDSSIIAQCFANPFDKDERQGLVHQGIVFITDQQDAKITVHYR